VRTPTLRQMESLNMDRAAPVLIRIYKEERTLEVWKQDRTGKFALLKSYSICKYSGTLGPKIAQGDYQAPEGIL
jgi:murein L,D-transpeptidase YafK